jgi:acyl carrier protein
MPEADVRSRVVAIVAEQALLDPAEVREDMTLAQLGLDSVGLMECIFAIEEAFEILVPFNANTPGTSAFDTSSVGRIADAVEALVAEQGRA